MRTLFASARALGGERGAVIELCLLTLCLPWEAVAMRLEAIQWRSGIVVVPARGKRGRKRIVALPNAALQAVLRLAGTAGAVGQVVTGGKGQNLDRRDVRLDRIQYRLQQASPDVEQIRWNFHGIRAAAISILREAGVPRLHVEELLGLDKFDGDPATTIDRIDRMIATAEIWCRILLADERQGSRSR